MKKVITYGTFDLLHYGHIRLLERAKRLGDYLIVGVTSDDFDRSRGKINVHQSMTDRVKAVRETGLADEVIVEEYEGQKIDDIRKYGIDVFAIGSDWEGKFDYLGAYCKVVYLPRTEGVSSSEIRREKRKVRIGVVGETPVVKKIVNESRYVDGCEITGICSEDGEFMEKEFDLPLKTENFSELIENVDAVYVASRPGMHYAHIKQALENGKHVLCESPITLSAAECRELFDLADKKGCILMDAIKTAYSTAYSRMLLIVKSGSIGRVVSVNAVCTSLRKNENGDKLFYFKNWNSMSAWGPTGLLPVFQLLGVDYKNKKVFSLFDDRAEDYDIYSKIDLEYDGAVATVQVGNGVKAEGELVIAGTDGYIYVPAPWWKTDYFEVRFEDGEKNRRYFYQLDGEGLRYEIVSFIKSIESKESIDVIDRRISEKICETVAVTNRKSSKNPR